MIKYSTATTGLSALVENIKTKEKFAVSTLRNPYGVYETAVCRAPNLWIAGLKGFFSRFVFVVNSSTAQQAEQTHIRTAELFEQLNPKDLIKKYKTEGKIGKMKVFASNDEDKTEELPLINAKDKIGKIISMIIGNYLSTVSFLLAKREFKKLPLSDFYQVMIEFLLFDLCFCDRQIFSMLGNKKKNIIMDGVVNSIFSIMKNTSAEKWLSLAREFASSDVNQYHEYFNATVSSENFVKKYNERQIEYSKYKINYAVENEPQAGTLTFEFGKKIAILVSGGPDIINVFYAQTYVMMNQISNSRDLREIFGLSEANDSAVTNNPVIIAFFNLLIDLMITEEDCGTLNGISIEPLIKDSKIVVSLEHRITGRYALDTIQDTVSNEIVVAGGQVISEEKAKWIKESDIKAVRIRNVLTCESEYGICLKCYGRYDLVGNLACIGENVGQQIASLWGEIEINNRLKDLLEARIPSNCAILCEIDGMARIIEESTGWKEIVVTSHTGMKREYPVPTDKEIKVKNGEKVLAGQALTDGEINPHDVLRICGDKILTEYMTSEIVPYLSKFNFNDERMIELPLRQMTGKVKIEDQGDTSFMPGQVVNKVEFHRENIAAIRKGNHPASATPLFIGMRL